MIITTTKQIMATPATTDGIATAISGDTVGKAVFVGCMVGSVQ